MTEDSVQDNPKAHRFEMRCPGTTAFLVYAKSPGSLRLIHREVPPQLKGKNIGSKLVDAALKVASGSGFEVIPRCPFATHYLKRHLEYADIVQPEYRNMVFTAVREGSAAVIQLHDEGK